MLDQMNKLKAPYKDSAKFADTALVQYGSKQLVAKLVAAQTNDKGEVVFLFVADAPTRTRNAKASEPVKPAKR